MMNVFEVYNNRLFVRDFFEEKHSGSIPRNACVSCET